MPRTIFCLSLVLLLQSAYAAVANEDIGRFAAAQIAPPAPWKSIQLDEKVPATRYRIMNWDGVGAIEAVAEGSMTLLARPLDIDLQRTPILCWRWRIDAPLRSADMRSKAGDDYAARVYVAFKLSPQALDFATRLKLGLARTLYGDHVPDAALNYVWDNRYPIGTQQANAYTDRAQMIVQRSGAAQAGQWISERRDVLADARQAFGNHVDAAVLLAVASDTDNTGEQARAGFADLHFVPREAGCSF